MTETSLKLKHLLVICTLLSVSTNAVAQTVKIENNALSNYKGRCAWCHGMEGKGDGPASEFLSPPPRNFTLGLNKFVSTVPGEITLPSKNDIYRAISNGLPGTAMKAWKNVFSDAEIWGLVEVVRSFTDIYRFEDSPETLPLTAKIPPSPKSLTKGRFLFRSAGCFECHGEEGRGDGNKLLREKSGTRIWPRNLTKPWTFKGGKTPEDIFRRISAGLPGTPMPAFGLRSKADSSVSKKTLSIEERWHLVNFVLSIKDGDYKNVGGIIKARYVNGHLPASLRDKRWKKAGWTSFYLSPNLIKGDKLFNPLNDIIRIKALYNDHALALLLVWSDRTKSLPLGKELEKLGGAELYQDSVALQFPMSPETRKNAHLGHGSAEREVTVWQWKSGTLKTPQITAVYSGRGLTTPLRTLKSLSAPLYSKGVYENGEWMVLIKNEDPASDKKAEYKPGEYIPVSIASWDGSNKERGSKHTFTRWGNIYLAPPEDHKKLLMPAAIFFIVLSLQVGIQRKISSNIRTIF